MERRAPIHDRRAAAQTPQGRDDDRERPFQRADGSDGLKKLAELHLLREVGASQCRAGQE